MREPQSPIDAELTALVDDARGADAAQERSRRRWLTQQAMEEATIAGVLSDAAEHRHTVTLRTVSGRQHTGVVVLVAADCCALRTTNGARTFIALDAITVIGVDRAFRPVAPAGERLAPAHATLRELLADEIDQRLGITIVCRGDDEALVGRLLAVGADILTLEIDDRRMLAYVSVSSVTEASLASG